MRTRIWSRIKVKVGYGSGSATLNLSFLMCVAQANQRTAVAADTQRLSGEQEGRLLAPAAGVLPAAPHHGGAGLRRRPKAGPRPLLHQAAGGGAPRAPRPRPHADQAEQRRELGRAGSGGPGGIKAHSIFKAVIMFFFCNSGTKASDEIFAYMKCSK